MKPLRSNLKRCAQCHNIARLGTELCGACEAANDAEQHATELMDAVRNAAMDMPEGPLSRFADAVVAWMDAR